MFDPTSDIPGGQPKQSPLLRHFKGIVSTPSDVETYDIKRWAQNAIKKAAYVLYPLDAEDVSTAILFARAEKLPIAICGGGNDALGASSSEGGVVIDMRKMNAVRVDKKSKVGYIQGGTTNRQAVEELFKEGMAAPLGMYGGVGVIGLSCSGGLGFKMGQYGLACDNIVSATMVLANGEIVPVDDEHHPDLLWGIKGGGSNFGVIAELGMRIHETRSDVCTIQHIYLPEQLPALVGELSAWLEVQTAPEFIQLVFALDPEDRKPYLIFSGVGDFSAEDGRRLWGRFVKLGPVKSKVSQVPYPQYGALADQVANIPGYKVGRGAHFNKFDYETVKKAYDMWLAVTSKVPTAIIRYEFYYYDLVPTVPVEATAFPQRTKDKTALVGVFGFADEKLMIEARKACTDLQECISSSSTEEARASGGNIGYAAFAASLNDTDASARQVFGPNYPRLQRIKRQHDPDMVFNKWFCVRPADE
ncbi:hypothetical protein FRB97_005250 [Tulasnella sp. 331]|nr:hypothetical protein FRB97_005250 [Tulasnella sp. 331]